MDYEFRFIVAQKGRGTSIVRVSSLPAYPCNITGKVHKIRTTFETKVKPSSALRETVASTMRVTPASSKSSSGSGGGSSNPASIHPRTKFNYTCPLFLYFSASCISRLTCTFGAVFIPRLQSMVSLSHHQRRHRGWCNVSLGRPFEFCGDYLVQIITPCQKCEGGHMLSPCNIHMIVLYQQTSTHMVTVIW